MVNRKMWGLTLLERNVRELDRLNFKQIYIHTAPGLDPLKHFCHKLPSGLEISVSVDGEPPAKGLSVLLKEAATPVLLLEGHALNDRRIIRALLEAEGETAAIGPVGQNPAVAAIAGAALVADAAADAGSLHDLIHAAVRDRRVAVLDLTRLDPYMPNLRRQVPPFLLKIESADQYRQAEVILKQTVQKGVLELVAKYLHPPLEFGAVRLIAETPITPNQITFVWLTLAALAIPLFATGHLLAGFLLAALCGVLDGVDGKLARLTLRYSNAGDWLDHASGTIYDALWYLAIGWYFSGGNPHSTAAQMTLILLIAYLIHRIVPGVFKLVHHREIYDYEKIDVFVRLICARMNHNVWLMLIGVSLGYPRASFYLMTAWMAVTAGWYIVRFLWVTLLPRPLAGVPPMTRLS